jgi:hypothetical protein
LVGQAERPANAIVLIFKRRSNFIPGLKNKKTRAGTSPALVVLI